MKLSRRGKNFIIGMWLFALSILDCYTSDATIPVLLGITASLFICQNYNKKGE